MDEQKRFLLAMVLSGLILGGYYLLFAKPMQEAAQAQRALDAQNQAQITEIQQAATGPVIKSRDTLLTPNTTVHPTPDTNATPTDSNWNETRIEIDTPSLSGSFTTKGSRFDDLRLKKYDATIDKDSDTVIMFSPEGAKNGAYVYDNWAKTGLGDGANTQWTQTNGSVLRVDQPITLTHTGDGFTVERVISVDADYLFTLNDTITNTTNSDISLTRNGMSRQHDLPLDLTNFFILQEGPIAVVDDKKFDMKYKKLSKKREASFAGKSGWAGLTDKYWLAAAIAPQGQNMTARFGFANRNTQDVYEAGYQLDPVIITSGASISSKGFIFAGAKQRTLLQTYEKEHGIAQMERAIDWGMLRILTRPFSLGLTKLGALTGNFGLGIIVLTFLIKIVLFPLNNKAYAGMAKMKALAPKVEKIKKRYGDDRVKLQQETMALYKKEGASPVAGCLPMIPQMFIFFALYKSLFITLEMRHAPFFGWIKDLSARDPLSILNGFGILPWDAIPFPALSMLAIGPLAILYGGSMALTQSLNTPPTGDKMQAKIFQYMPWFFMFILAPFATGLLVYWVWNNILTFIQQYIITRKFKIETPLDRFIGKIMGKTKAESE